MSTLQTSAIKLQKLDLYNDRKSITMELFGKSLGLRELTHKQHAELQDWCDRYADAHSISISDKNKIKPGDKQRKKILAMAHELHWRKNGKVDMERVNAWCKTYGQFKKELNDHTAQELPALVTQFEKVYIHDLKAIRR